MSETLTIRTTRQLRQALEARARAQGRTLSELAREILERSIEERPLGERTGHLRGRLRLSPPGRETWRAVLHDRNWRR